MLDDIYKKGPLKYPETFQSDNGSEFKGWVTKLLEKHNVNINRATTKYRHRFTAFVERLNRNPCRKFYIRYKTLKSSITQKKILKYGLKIFKIYLKK